MSTEDDDTANQKSLILKIASKNHKLRIDSNIRNAFLCEIYMYDEVSFFPLKCTGGRSYVDKYFILFFRFYPISMTFNFQKV